MCYSNLSTYRIHAKARITISWGKDLNNASNKEKRTSHIKKY